MRLYERTVTATTAITATSAAKGAEEAADERLSESVSLCPSTLDSSKVLGLVEALSLSALSCAFFFACFDPTY